MYKMMPEPDLLALQRLQLAHMHQHAQGKYVGSPAETLKSLTLRLGQHTSTLYVARRREQAVRTLNDSLIMTFALASTFNVDLAERVPPERQPFEMLPHYQGIAKGLLLPVGRLAKAAEATDHLEDYPSRRESCNEAVNICQMLLSAAQLMRVDVAQTVPARLEQMTGQRSCYPHIRKQLPQPLYPPGLFG